MTDHDHGAAGARPVTQGRQDRRAVGVIEIAGRLVCEQEGRIVEHRAAEGHALLLAARELRRMVVTPLRHAEPLEQDHRAAAPLGVDAGRITRGQQDVVERGE